MPEFILDTAGEVLSACPVSWAPEAQSIIRWSDLDAFTQGYIEALFFTETAPGVTTEEWQAEGFEPQEGSIPEDVAFADLAPETLAAILKDCAAFQARELILPGEDAAERSQVATFLFEEGARAGFSGTASEAGRDFWYTRNGHGCGFWDGDWPEPYASALTEASKAFREVDVYLGDDGLVYLG